MNQMGSMEEKAILKIDDEGGVVSCAKGASADKCGYKPGAKVCGACGAMAVKQKVAMQMMAEEDEDMEDDDMPDEETEDMEDMSKEKGKGKNSRMRRKASMMPMGKPSMQGGPKPAMEEEDDEETSDADEMMLRRRQARLAAMAEDEVDEEEVEKGWMMKPNKRSRNRAMNSMGMKSEDFDNEEVFLCRSERKVLPMQSDVCSKCVGGCAPEGEMPGLLDIEGMALELFGGKVLSSVYADEADMFVVDILAKDGSAIELIADGSTGEIRNFHRIAPTDFSGSMGVKSLQSDTAAKVIDIASAQTIALKALESEVRTSGTVIQADSEIFEGFDSYVFEIDALNGKSYDVFVGINGTVLGYDEYDALEAKQIEEEAAEIALKRAYSEEQRESMAEGGMALPDGSYPIKDVADLRNAIQAYGRAKDKEAAKLHIMKRAKDLGKEDLIPEEWGSKGGFRSLNADSKDVQVSDDNSFIKQLMEFEILALEEDLKADS
jgi:hypothetical protein